MPRLQRGLLIAIEGIDGAGKTTQSSALGSTLRNWGFQVVETKEPTRGKWGHLLRSSASSHRLSPEEELEAFMRDRREHVSELINPSLEAGKIVVVDRYYFSNAAYQGARGQDPSHILKANEDFAPQPDVMVHLDVTPELGIERIRRRGDKPNNFEQAEYLGAVAEIFRKFDGAYVLHVDGTKQIEPITTEILSRIQNGPLFREMCLRKDKVACEPAYCIFRYTNECEWVRLPVAANGGTETLS